LTWPVRKLRTGLLLPPGFWSNSGGTDELTFATAFRALHFASQVLERDAAIELIPVMSEKLVNTGNDCENAATPAERLTCANDLILKTLDNVDLGQMFTGSSPDSQADIGSVCGARRAAGMTRFKGAIYAPSVDTLIHEIGHQLGARHSYNGNIRNRAAVGGFEPEIGSTVMSYAQIGQPASVQDYRDQYFHVGSLNQILAALPKCDDTTSACGCGGLLATSSAAPTITAATNLVALRRTAFRLKAALSTSATSASEKYRSRWEEIDLGTAADSVPPLYRSRPSSESDRTFPAWDKVWSGTYHEGDRLFDKCSANPPNAKCKLRFQLTVRAEDRRTTALHATTVELSTAGPLTVAAQSTSGAVNVTWKIGGLVNNALPSGLQRDVDIKIGTNAADTAWHTSGSAQLDDRKFAIATYPFSAGTTVRVLVEAKDGSYLALSGPVTLK
jgi:hypothetical protein